MTDQPHIRVAVHGAAGRVGREVLRAVDAAPDMALVAAVDRFPPADVPDLPVPGVPYYDDVARALDERPADVIVDFSLAAATAAMAPQALALGARPVIGTTGHSPEQLAELARLCGVHGLSALVAPNFTIGAVLLAKLAAVAAPWFDYVDLVEEHHEMKVDSPSGTALGIARAIREAHPAPFARNDPEREPLPGARGADYDGISIHAARMPGRMAHHQVTFGGPGQTLSLRHDTTDRECYMPGVLLAVRKIGGLSGLTIGLDALLEL